MHGRIAAAPSTGKTLGEARVLSESFKTQAIQTGSLCQKSTILYMMQSQVTFGGMVLLGIHSPFPHACLKVSHHWGGERKRWKPAADRGRSWQRKLDVMSCPVGTNAALEMYKYSSRLTRSWQLTQCLKRLHHPSLHGGLKAGEVGEDFILGSGTCARVNEVIRLCCGCRQASHACQVSARASQTDSRRAASETKLLCRSSSEDTTSRPMFSCPLI